MQLVQTKLQKAANRLTVCTLLLSQHCIPDTHLPCSLRMWLNEMKFPGLTLGVIRHLNCNSSAVAESFCFSASCRQKSVIPSLLWGAVGVFGRGKHHSSIDLSLMQRKVHVTRFMLFFATKDRWRGQGGTKHGVIVSGMCKGCKMLHYTIKKNPSRYILRKTP